MKAKRLLALLLALVMVVGLFAMTASALSYVNCSACERLGLSGTAKTYISGYGSWYNTNVRTVTGCSAMTGTHTHYDRQRDIYYSCYTHGYLYSGTDTNPNLCFGG